MGSVHRHRWPSFAARQAPAAPSGASLSQAGTSARRTQSPSILVPMLRASECHIAPRGTNPLILLRAVLMFGERCSRFLTKRVLGAQEQTLPLGT